MRSETKRGKCPKCCPDGGAIFHKESRIGDDDRFVTVWQCNNCNYETPVRVIPRPTKPNARQMRLIKAIRKIFGGYAKFEVIGRNVFVSFKNYKRKWWEGTIVCGTIGTHGKLDLTIYLSKAVKLESMVSVGVYCEQRKVVA